MAPIVWLASYPKSGNTWVRAFLTNYVGNTERPASINALDGALIASHRPTFDEVVGVSASDLTEAEISRFRPSVYRHLAETNRESPLFIKVHDAYRHGPETAPLFPEDADTRALYVVRNPLDVAVSMAHYFRLSLPESVRRLAEGWTLASPGDGLKIQLAQVLLSWSDHARSWLDAPACSAHLVRFEDLVVTPGPAFAGVVAAAGLACDSDRLERAIAFSSFDVLRSQEESTGFTERIASSAKFFRRGGVGTWRDELAPALAASIIASHYSMMLRLGYVNDDGEPQC